MDSTNIDALSQASLPSIKTQVSNFLRWLARKTEDDRFGAVEVPDNLGELAAVVGVVDDERLEHLERHMVDEGLIELVPENYLRLTPKAWALFEPTPEAKASKADLPPKEAAATFPVERSTCPQCGPNRFGEIVASFEETDEDGDVYSIVKYSIIKCRGCGELHARRIDLFSEDVDYEQDPHTGEWNTVLKPTTAYWPSIMKRPKPTWLMYCEDEILRHLVDEVYAALNSDLLTVAAMGLRAILDRTFDIAGADPAVSFDQKIKTLTGDGVIGAQEGENLKVMTDAGSAAAHRGWRPDYSQLITILETTESVVNGITVLRKRAAELKSAVPPRPQRRSKKDDPPRPSRSDAENSKPEI